MSDEKNEDFEDKVDETLDNSSEKEKSNIPQNQTKVNKVPSFPNQNRFGKGTFNNNNFNSRQRVGRGASRGR